MLCQVLGGAVGVLAAAVVVVFEGETPAVVHGVGAAVAEGKGAEEVAPGTEDDVATLAAVVEAATWRAARSWFGARWCKTIREEGVLALPRERLASRERRHTGSIVPCVESVGERV